MTNQFPECDDLPDAVRAFCRGETSTVEACNLMRTGWGLTPLPAGFVIQKSKAHKASIALAVPFCRHRGESVATLSGNNCACDRRVYACAHKGRCVQLDPGKATAAKLITEARRNGLQICAECELFEDIPQ